MKFLKKIINRFTIVSIILLIQLAWIIIIPLYLSSYYYAFSLLFTLLSLVIVSFIINKQTDPNIKLAWIVPILIIPILGWVIYILFGTRLSTSSIRKKLNKSDKFTVKRLPRADSVVDKIALEDPHIAGQCKYIANNCFPVYTGTSTSFFGSGEEMFPVILSELKKAEKFIFIEFFIINEGQMWNSILQILIQKVREGVDVRVIYDDMGSINYLPSKYYMSLERMGIKCISFNRFRPFLSIVMNNRDHRKILVIDGNTGFTGGVNLSDEYINAVRRFGYWKDSGVMLKGQAVASLTTLFLEMWNSIRPDDSEIESFMPTVTDESDGYVQPYGDSPLDSEILGENVYLNIINQAEKYVYIYTPYLIIDNVISEALTLAAKRGVDVRIVIPGIPDKKIIYQLSKSHCPALIKAGVRIYDYTPGFLHSKCFVCDDLIATVGTINMDYRSLYIHFENGCFFYKSSVVAALYKDFTDTFAKSSPTQLTNKKIGIIKNFYYALLRLISPLL